MDACGLSNASGPRQRDLERANGRIYMRRFQGSRICRACATKARGSWKCAICQQILPQDRFETFKQRRPSGKDGTQACDKCLQAAVVTPIAVRTALRLTRSRQKVRNKEILEEVRREIAAQVRVRGTDGETPEEPGPKRARPHSGPSTNFDHKLVAQEQEQKQSIPPGERSQGHEQVLGPQNGQATERTEYECPYCQEKTYSSVWTGKVHARGHCGKEFRVRNGVVVRAFTHACPKCGTEVQSAKAAGKIQSKHKTPKGKTCGTTTWVRK